MIEKNEGKKLDDAMKKYENIRKALKGITEIVNINFREDDIYYLAAMDNLKEINSILTDLLKESFTPREVRIKMREIELDELEAENY